jgi:PAS domain S-box-containing protein
LRTTSSKKPDPPPTPEGGTRFFLGSLGGSLGSAEIALGDLIERTRDAVLLIDRDNVIRYWNQGADAMFQYTREEVLGRKIGFLLPKDLLEARELDWIQGRIDADGCLFNFVTRRVRKDGGERWVSLTRSRLHDTSGKVIGSTAVFRDITEERRIHEELSRSRGMAIVGEMAATLAHQIKNRLAGIYAAVQLLSRDLPPGDLRREVFDDVTREVKRLDETAHDLLRYAQPAPLHRVPTELSAFLESVVGSLELLPEVRRHQIEIQVPEKVVVPLDPASISQVLNNLILNAAEAMETPGRILLAARSLDGSVEIDVADEGPGIPAGTLPSIFQPFFTTKSQGTGLGLSISSKNLEAHGGTILVQSELGKGTRFTIRLPVAPAAPDPKFGRGA